MASLILQGGHYEWSFTNGGNTYASANIVSGTLTDGVYQQASFGNCISRQLNLRLWNVTLDTTSPIVLSCIEVAADETETAHAVGTFYIDTVSTSPYSEYTEVTAFDAMLKTEAVYMKEGTWTATTASAVISEIMSSIGITSMDSASASYFTQNDIAIDQAPSIGENGTTMRQMLSMIGCLYGGNWVIDNSNLLSFVPLYGQIKMVSSVATRDFVLTPTVVGDEVREFDKSDLESIVGIEFQANGGQTFRAPSNLTDDQWDALDGLILFCNLPCMASQDAVDAVWAIYGSLSSTAQQYIPYTANGVYLDPWVTIGSLATIKNTDVFVSNRTINIDHLGTCDLSANPTKQVTSHYPYVSPQVREARQKAEENYAAITVNTESIVAEASARAEEDGNLSQQITSVQVTAEEFSVWHTIQTGQTQSSATTEMQGEANAAVNAYDQTVQTYMRYSGGTLELGEQGSNFKAKLNNTKLAFTGSDGQEAAWISNNELYINQAVINTNLKMGNWVQQVKDGHFQIRYIS